MIRTGVGFFRDSKVESLHKSQQQTGGFLSGSQSQERRKKVGGLLRNRIKLIHLISSKQYYLKDE